MLQKNKIYEMDCLIGLKMIDDNSVDLIINDPPYLISQNREFTRGKTKVVTLTFEWDDVFKSEKDYFNFIKKVVDENYRVLKDTGSIYMFISDRFNSHLRDYMIKVGFHYKNTLVWRKTNPVPHFMKNNYCNSYEFCDFACKNPKTFTFNFKFQKEMHNVIETPILLKRKISDGLDIREDHKSQKPLALIKHFIEISSNPEDIVLDCFMGSGTTAAACKQLNRDFIGFEINPEYIKIANKRLKQSSVSDFFPAENGIIVNSDSSLRSLPSSQNLKVLDEPEAN